MCPPHAHANLIVTYSHCRLKVQTRYNAHKQLMKHASLTVFIVFLGLFNLILGEKCCNMSFRWAFIGFRVTSQKYSLVCLGIALVCKEENVCIDTGDGHQEKEEHQWWLPNCIGCWITATCVVSCAIVIL
jgi:hypothetical protein